MIIGIIITVIEFLMVIIQNLLNLVYNDYDYVFVFMYHSNIVIDY